MRPKTLEVAIITSLTYPPRFDLSVEAASFR